MNGTIKILSLLTLLSGLLINSSLGINTYENLSLCPFDPQVDEQVLEIMDQNYVPSSVVAVVRNTSIIWAKGYGEHPELDLIYMIGSVTKTFTATAIFQLYEQGLINLDDDVNEYLPFSLRHPNYTDTPITIRMLLQHRSGLSKDSDMYWYGVLAEAVHDLGWENPYDWLSYPYWIEGHLTPHGSLYNSSVWTSNKPGTVRFYSNFGYDVLGYLIQLATGKPIWDYFQENIFDPLGLHSTGYNYTNFDITQLAIPYIYRFDIDSESTGNKAYPNYSTFNYGCGGLRSNIFDLAKFLLVFLHKGVSNGTRILEEDTLQTMVEMQSAWLAPGDPLIQWDGWGGSEGDDWAFHAKVYAIYDGNTTVPYGVITLLNQGSDSARNAAYQITRLLQISVHKYDITATDCTIDLIPIETIIIAVTSVAAIIVLVILIRRRSN